jgi:TolA-binding protein
LVHSEAGGGSNAATPASPAVSAATLFSAANQARRGGDLAQAGLLYRALQQQFPRSSEAQLSRVTLGTLLLNSDPLAALSSFDAYLRSGAQPLAAEALVGRARALRALGRRSEAQAAWQEVVARYPNSLYAKQARDTLSAAAPP